MSNGKTYNVTVRLDEPKKNALQKYSKRNKRSMALQLQLLVERFLENERRKNTNGAQKK